MPRPCSICVHPACHEIDMALVSGEPYRQVAKRFEASDQAMYRHKQEHLPVVLAKAHAAKEVVLADSLLERINHLERRALAILETVEAAGAFETALRAIREARSCLEVCAKLRGELQQEGTTNITINAEWVAVRTVLLQALAPYPDARAAVAAALLEVDA
jgi:hypothetical protein